jgi:mannan endo-1,4-beta-mannosidase
MRSLRFWILATLTPTSFSLATETADPKADPTARQVLKYIAGLHEPPQPRILSGQFTNYGTGARLKECEDTFHKTGHWPALIGLDYAEFGTGGLDYKNVDRIAIDYAKHGGLVTISAHLPNPANPRGGGINDKGVDLETLLTVGHPNHERWMRELDTLAAGLGVLQDANVTVLWRPFHEMNGGWFWWGDKPPASFIRLWRHMFDHFTRVKGLHNLLWVYGPNHGNKVTTFYPGDTYVDLIGLDAYTDFVDPDHIKGYDEITRINKPFGFTEFGPHGASDPPGTYDYREFLIGIRRNFPKTSFFLAWHNNWSLSRNHHGKELLANPTIINRDQLPPALTTKTHPRLKQQKS